MEEITRVNIVPIKAPRKKPTAWLFASRPPAVSLMLRFSERKNQKIELIKIPIPNSNDAIGRLKISNARKLPICAAICIAPIVLQHTNTM
jgi:hypothetical protein